MDKVHLGRYATNTYDRQAYNNVLTQLEKVINKSSDGYIFNIRSISSSATLNDSDNIVLVDATGGAVNLILPIALKTENKIIYVKKLDASANAVMITPQDVSTIDGAANKSTTTQYAVFRLTALNGNWYLL